MIDERAGGRIPFAPQMLDQMDWATLNSLANRFRGEVADEEMLAAAEPLAQLAQLNVGTSAMTPAQIAEYERATGDKSLRPGYKDPTPQTVSPWGKGSDGQVTQDWRKRQVEAQALERDRLIRQQQERAKKLRQQGG